MILQELLCPLLCPEPVACPVMMTPPGRQLCSPAWPLLRVLQVPHGAGEEEEEEEEEEAR